MKYEEFINKLKESPEKYEELVKNEYDAWLRREERCRDVAIALIGVAIGVGKFIGLIYGMITLITALTCLLVSLHYIERNLSELRDLLIGVNENCTVSLMSGIKEILQREVFVIGLAIATAIMLIMMWLGI